MGIQLYGIILCCLPVFGSQNPGLCGPLAVRVFDLYGREVERSEVAIAGPGTNLTSLASPHRFKSVPCGELLVTASASGFGKALRTCKAGKGENLVVIGLELAPLGDPVPDESITVTGIVMNSTPGLDIIKLVAVFGDSVHWATPGNNGRFTLHGLPGGKFLVLVLREGQLIHQEELTVHSKTPPIAIRLKRPIGHQ